MTYYKYVKRNAESQPNWAEVAKGISDTLIKTRDAREQKRQEIDERIRKFGDLLDNAPQGDNIELNKQTLEAADQSKELLRINQNLLRSGMMKPKDYNLFHQTLSDDWDNYSSFVEETQKEWTDKMTRYQNGESSLQEVREMEFLEGLGNFNSAKINVDHMTGRIGIGRRRLNNDGTYSEDVEDMMSINELRNRLKRKIDRVNVVDELTPMIESLGQHIEVMRRSGILTEENIFRRDLNPEEEEVVSTYRRAQEDYINSIITSPDKASSILLDTIGQIDGKAVTTAYAATQEEAEEIKGKGDDSVVVLLRDPKSGNYFADITDSQRQRIVSSLRDQADVMVDIKQTPMPERQPVDSGGGSGEAEVKQDAISSLAQLWYGSAEQIDSAAKFLGNLKVGDSDVLDIDRREDRVIVKYRTPDGDDREQPFLLKKNGQQVSQKSFIESMASFFGITNVEEALPSSRYNPDAAFSTATGRFTVTEIPDEFNKQVSLEDGEFINVKQLFNDYVPDFGSFTKQSKEDASASEAASIISQAFTGLGSLNQGQSTKNVKVGDGTAIQVFLPKVMTGPVFVPLSGATGSVLETLTKYIYDTARGGSAVMPSQLQDLIPEFATYNNAGTYAEAGYPAAMWNEGVGDMSGAAGKRLLEAEQSDVVRSDESVIDTSGYN
jgi:hypothetical protein